MTVTITCNATVVCALRWLCCVSCRTSIASWTRMASSGTTSPSSRQDVTPSYSIVMYAFYSRGNSERGGICHACARTLLEAAVQPVGGPLRGVGAWRCVNYTRLGWFCVLFVMPVSYVCLCARFRAVYLLTCVIHRIARLRCIERANTAVFP